MSVRLDQGEDTLAEVHEINVTPFIDVMLVLLIIFMVAAPLATVDIQVNLPASTAEPQMRPPKPLYLTLKPDLTIALGDDPVPRDDLRGRLDAATSGDKETRIFLRADKAVPYGELMEVMNVLRDGGYLKIALVGLEKSKPVIALAVDDVADLRRWLISGAVVVLAHGALAGALLKWYQEAEVEEPSGAIVIEFAPAPVGPPVANADIPPGPQQVMSEAVPDQPLERAQEKTEQKVETPPQEEPPPDVKPALNPQMPVEPPVTQEIKPQPDPRQEPRPPVPTTSAPRVVPSQAAAVAAAPVQGRLTAKVSTAVPTWTSRLVALLERNKRYPPAAQARGEEGVAQVFFKLDRAGRLVESRIVKSSGAPVLDEEALALLQRAQPFPPPPAELSGPQVALTVPIRFNLK